MLKHDDFLDAIDGIGEDVVEKFMKMDEHPTAIARPKKPQAYKWLSVAASLVFVFGLSLGMIWISKHSNPKLPVEEDNTTQNSTTESTAPIIIGEEESKQTNDTEFLSYMKTYINTEGVSKKVLYLYNEADKIDVLPLLGPYFEESGKAMYVFYKDGYLIGIANMEVAIDPSAAYYILPISDPTFVNTFSDETCLRRIKKTIKEHPDFKILGLVYNTIGYPCIIPVGIVEGESYVKYIFNLNVPTEFNLVAPFTSVEEGRKAFADFLAWRETLDTNIPIYPWVTIPEDRQMDFNMCYHTVLSEEYFERTDNSFFIPLVDSTLKEDIYYMFLLFDNSDLIGQIVVRRDRQDLESDLSIVWDIHNQKENGEYAPMDNIPYVEIVNAALQSGMEVEGVIFEDGKFIPYCHVDGEIVYYTE